MKALTILKRARKLLTNPKRWEQNAFASTRGGALAKVLDKDAYQFCAAGAMYRVAGEEVSAGKSPELLEAFGILERCVPQRDLLGYNDASKRKHEQVLAVFDKAIARAEKAALMAKSKARSKNGAWHG